ncbi:MAG: hypothetical protein DRJ05_03240 [Bacteroidetes bacterium]|nr:MAG: hypothetical protein DRJ05_03240 [Bacteroidota bacterium]
MIAKTNIKTTETAVSLLKNSLFFMDFLFSAILLPISPVTKPKTESPTSIINTVSILSFCIYD